MKSRADFYRHQFEAVEESLESWKKDHDEAMEVRDLEHVIRFCLTLDEETRNMVRDAWDAGFEARVPDVQGVGQSLLKCLDAGVEAWENLTKATRDFQAKGYSVDNADTPPKLLSAMRKLRDDFAARWPTFTEEELRRGQGQVARGEFVTGEEFGRALQNQSRQGR